MKKINIPTVLKNIKNPPKELFAIGNTSLLDLPKIAIVGSRNALFYSKEITFNLAKKLSLSNIAVISGGAIGIDAQAHKGALPNTIAVLASSLDNFYPKINEKLLRDISQQGLLLSEHAIGTKTSKYSFVLRNRLVVGLCDALVIAQADEDSGSMRSAEFAKDFDKPIYVLPHRINESNGTAKLVKNGDAKEIYSIDEFVSLFTKNRKNFLHVEHVKDEILEFCKKHDSLNACLDRFGDKIYEYELEGKIKISQMKVVVL